LFVNHFQGRGLDGVTINKTLKIIYISEFKRSRDRDKGGQVKEADTNEHHKSIIVVLRAAAPEWELSSWWVTADRVLKATSTPSTKSLMYKKARKTNSSPIRWHRYAKRTIT